MSNAEHEPTHLPEADRHCSPIGYAIGVQFHEPLKLIPQKGLEFAAKLADYIDPRGVVVKDDAWIFTQPLGDSGRIPSGCCAPSGGYVGRSIPCEFPGVA